MLDGIKHRIYVSGIILYTASKCPQSLLFVTLLPFILDAVDCTRVGKWTSLSFTDGEDCKSKAYQSQDKVVDTLSYAALVLILRKQYTPVELYYLALFILWRGIGVYKFYSDGDSRHLIRHFDAVNSTMIAVYTLSLLYGDKRPLYLVIPSILAGAYAKHQYEIWHHHNVVYDR